LLIFYLQDAMGVKIIETFIQHHYNYVRDC
jgi:hypothetical protein